MSRILIVEDDPAITKILTTILSTRGHDVISAADGVEGESAFDNDSPDLVVLDIGLPERSGLDVLGHIRDSSAAPVIMLTALVDLGDTALAAGASAFLTKPFDIDTVVSTAEHLLAQT